MATHWDNEVEESQYPDRVIQRLKDQNAELLSALKALLDLDIYAHGEGVITFGAVNEREVNAAHALVNRLS